MKNYTLITGGASGLGRDLSNLFAKDKNNLFLVSSNIQNLEKAKQEIEKEYQVEVKVLALDLSNPDNFHLVKEFTDKNEMHIDILVNCAGFGDRCDFVDMDIDRQIKMIELNCNCPLYLMGSYVKDMVAEKRGHIINISSIAGFVPGPFMCTYHASKAFINNISEAIERELKGTGVNVTTVCPGPFDSGFVSKAHNDYTFKKIKPVTSEKIAEITYKAYKKNKSVKIIGFKNKLMIFFSRLVPRKMVVDTSAKQIKEKV